MNSSLGCLVAANFWPTNIPASENPVGGFGPAVKALLGWYQDYRPKQVVSMVLSVQRNHEAY